MSRFSDLRPIILSTFINRIVSKVQVRLIEIFPRIFLTTNLTYDARARIFFGCKESKNQFIWFCLRDKNGYLIHARARSIGIATSTEKESKYILEVLRYDAISR